MSTFHAGQIIWESDDDRKLSLPLPRPDDLPLTSWRLMVWGSQRSILEQCNEIVEIMRIPKRRSPMVSIGTFDSGEHFGNRCTMDGLKRNRVIYVDRLINETVNVIGEMAKLRGERQSGRNTDASLTRTALIQQADHVIKAVESGGHPDIAHIRSIAASFTSAYTDDVVWLTRFAKFRFALVSPDWAPTDHDAYFNSPEEAISLGRRQAA